jgi:hypothetical protein
MQRPADPPAFFFSLLFGFLMADSSAPQNPEEVKKMEEIMEAGGQDPALEQKEKNDQGEILVESSEGEEVEEVEEEEDSGECELVEIEPPAAVHGAITKWLLSDTKGMGVAEKKA